MVPVPRSGRLLLLFDVLGIEVIGVSVDSWGAVVVKSRHMYAG